jgi:hypothetical protein
MTVILPTAFDNIEDLPSPSGGTNSSNTPPKTENIDN